MAGSDGELNRCGLIISTKMYVIQSSRAVA